MSRSILGMPTFRESFSPLHQGEEQPDTELSLHSFLCYTTYWSSEGKEENCGWEGEVGEIGQFSIIGRMISHILFM